MSQPKREWQDARAKVEAEGVCRVCPIGSLNLEAAHVTGRKHDRPKTPGSKTRYVDPDSIVPLCPTHHRQYDAHAFDLLSYLETPEQIRAVEDLGSIESARRRLYPSAYKPAQPENREGSR